MDTTTGARLPLRDAPRTGESINGYIARMAQRNHLERADWVAKTAGIKFPQVSYSDDEIDRLAITTGQDFQTLRPIAPTPGVKTAIGRVSSLLGHDIPSDSLVRVGRRVCPICLIESAEHQIAWALRFARFCTKHGCRLINACPSCGKDLDWRTRAPDVCHCGHDLHFQQDIESRAGRNRWSEIPCRYVAWVTPRRITHASRAEIRRDLFRGPETGGIRSKSRRFFLARRYDERTGRYLAHESAQANGSRS